jgi:hypothetical protein
MKLRPILIYAAATLALVFGGLVAYESNRFIGGAGEVAFLSVSIQSPYSSKVAKRLLVPGASPEEPEWLAEAQSDPDPKTRLNAIKAAAYSTRKTLPARQ